MHKINWTKAVLAGIAGTILFDIFGLISGSGWWDMRLSKKVYWQLFRLNNLGCLSRLTLYPSLSNGEGLNV